ncbi:MAG: cyclic nucleotide-binding protein [Moraxellaceae bacterium]|nr:MAG: cyclic nucleotide-binding protein [Moraxellaceae bacterium]
MDVDERIELLQSVPVFGGIKPDVIRLLLNQSSSKVLGKGHYVFQEGDHSSAMYVIETGEIAIIKRSEDRHYLLRRMQSGDCIGEMALFDFMPRSASAYVLKDSRMITITSADLMEIYESDLEQFALLQMNMGREVTRRLRMADESSFRQRVEAEIINGSIEFFDKDRADANAAKDSAG